MGVHLLASLGTAPVLAGEGQPAAGAGMLPLLIIGGALIAFMMWSNRRRQKQAANFRASLRPGQRVQLLGGMLGTLVTVGEREVFVELAPGVVVTAVPQAVQGLVHDLPEDEIADENIDADIPESDDTSDN